MGTARDHNGIEMFREKVRVEKCQEKLCSFGIDGLQPCTKYNVCVSTKFMKSKCAGEECVEVKTASCVKSIHLNYTVVASAGGMVLLISLLSVVVCHKYKRVT